MKTIIFGIAIMAVLLTACDSNSNPSKESNKKNIQASNPGEKNAGSVNQVLKSYLQVKNALVNDDGKQAAAAGKALSEAIQKIDEGGFTAEQKKMFQEVKGDINEHGEHISVNGDKIAHQREHFDMLSKDMYDLVKAFGSTQTLYKDYCPMYNDEKGATWLSEGKEIQNPYLGKKMSDCGSVEEEMK